MNKLKTILLIILLAQGAFGTIRYVSKNVDSTPPYTSWETASDSIQKCINICVDGDTVIVGNGVYKETLIITKAVTIIGSSMDSTIIDGSGLIGNLISFVTIHLQSDCSFNNLQIKGKSQTDGNETAIFAPYEYQVTVKNCKVNSTGNCITMITKPSIVENCILSDFTLEGIWVGFANAKIYNNVIDLTSKGERGILNEAGGNPEIINNIILLKNWSTWEYGINFDWYFNSAKIKNNLIYNSKNMGMYFLPNEDTLEIINNIIKGNKNKGISISGMEKVKVKNNIIMGNNIGLSTSGAITSNYDLYWANQNNTGNQATMGENDIEGDPMFVSDSLPYYSKTDLRLQKYSPAIDAGDPNILDVDGSRSDIGMYGGPYGISYTYLDYPPKPPVNISSVIDYDSMKVILNWERNSESDFSHYRIYRDTTSFTLPDTSRLIGITDTSYFEDGIGFAKTGKVFYRITAVDSQENESISSGIVSVNITDASEPKTELLSEYNLYQNYPNPFNGTTHIGFSLKDRATVRILIYDIKGELLGMIENSEKEGGYHETEFSVRDFKGGLASGIYLYRIEVTDAKGIPRYAGMKKMIYLK